MESAKVVHCHLSPLYFDIILEALAIAIRQDNLITGLVCKKSEFKLVPYVRDTF